MEYINMDLEFVYRHISTAIDMLNHDYPVVQVHQSGLAYHHLTFKSLPTFSCAQSVLQNCTIVIYSKQSLTMPETTPAIGTRSKLAFTHFHLECTLGLTNTMIYFYQSNIHKKVKCNISSLNIFFFLCFIRNAYNCQTMCTLQARLA